MINSWLRSGLIVVVVLASGTAYGQRNLTDIPSSDPEIERKSFILGEGLEVNLFAGDPGIAKPIQMNFDPQGRLWIASSEIYPHIKPGEKANDRILIVEDTDGDGTADKTTVFADGLLIPTGVVPGDGGVYVANSTELLHLSDKDGDGKADRERVVLSGFGTEDTHHILHTLRWGPEGLLYFNQSIYIHSHIETPWGVRRLNAGGIWQFRPETMQLEVFARGWVNTWGHHFDRFGQSFATDGAGGEGINYVIPGAAYPTAQGVPRIFHGLNPGSPKYCGMEVVSGAHLPDDWQGNILTNDFRGNRVCRFVISEDGAGYAAREQAEVIRTKHIAFRPIDIKMGPDGAIYIADWYNPIIQHGEVDFRDPRRDHVHGRIWRVTFKNRSLVKRPKLEDAPVSHLLEQLASTEDWTREMAKRVLKRRGREAVLPGLAAWIGRLDAKDPKREHLRLEGLWVYQALREVNADLLASLLTASDPRVRAAAVRVLQHWQTEFPDAFPALVRAVADEHPRVRLEAVRVLSEAGNPEAVQAALTALDQPMDRFLDYAIWLTSWETRDTWLPAFESGEFTFGGNAEHLTFALTAVGSPSVVPRLIDLLREDRLAGQRWNEAVNLVVARGNASHFGEALKVAAVETDSAQQIALLRALIATSRQRKLRPSGDLNELDAMLSDDQSVSLRSVAVEAVGQWQVARHSQTLHKLAADRDASPALRSAAIFGLASIGGDASLKQLRELAASANEAYSAREAAVRGLSQRNIQEGGKATIALLASSPENAEPSGLVSTLISSKGGPGAMASALKGAKLSADVAKLAIRAIDSSGRKLDALKSAFSTAGSIKAGARKLSAQEMQQFVTKVVEHGDAERGEAVFRRTELSCFKCHAIGGAGGNVGPDLASIGGSAQVDYLIESMLDPNSKVKEGFHTIIVIKEDGTTASGIKVRQSDTALILRDAEAREFSIPLSDIDEQVNGTSLMPAGLTERLTESEMVDLVKFMSRLGKVGGVRVGRDRVVRRWQTLKSTQEAAFRLRRTRLGSVTLDDPAFVWEPAYSRVNGELPLNEIPNLTYRGSIQVSASGLKFVRFEVEVGTAGKVNLFVNDGEGLTAWLNAVPLELSSSTELDLSAGRHRVTVSLDGARKTPLQMRIDDVDGSPAQVQIVGGR